MLESIEVDDPTYIRAYVVTKDSRWKLILQIDPDASKMTCMSWHLAPSK